MKKLFTIVVASFALNVSAAEITGAGATFPAPLYSKWASDYQKATGNRVNYQSIGSSGGIRQIQARTVDFGATDKPLTKDELDKSGLIQFPAIIGGVVAVFNLPGIKQLKLTGPVLADIYLGKIKTWNDDAIVKLNPEVKLPNQPISVIRRADGSGTTFLFTDYLSKVSPEWKTKIGADASVQWPVGLGGKGNEGVAAFVQRVSGSIGYVEYAYAKQNKFPVVLLQNKAGTFVDPDDTTFAEASSSADWKGTPGFAVILTDQPGKNAYPITGASFILVEAQPKNVAKTQDAIKFFMWAFENGSKAAADLDYVMIPPSTVQLIRRELDRIK